VLAEQREAGGSIGALLAIVQLLSLDHRQVLEVVMLVMLLANLLAKRSAKVPRHTASRPA
jgi:hypothetical protein